MWGIITEGYLEYEFEKNRYIDIADVDDDNRPTITLGMHDAKSLWPILKEFAETGEVKG